MCCYIVPLNKLCISRNSQSQKFETNVWKSLILISPENTYLCSKPSPPSQSGDNWDKASPSGSTVWRIFHQGFCNSWFLWFWKAYFSDSQKLMQSRPSCLQDFAFILYAVDFGINLGIQCFSDLQSMSSYLGSVFIILDDTENKKRRTRSSNKWFQERTN